MVKLSRYHPVRREYTHFKTAFLAEDSVWVDYFKVGVVLTNIIIIASIWLTRYL